MYTDKIREAFEKIGYSGNTQINQQKFNDILSKLMVILTLSSPQNPEKHMIRMSQISCGNRHQEAIIILRSRRSVRPSMMASRFCSSSWMRLIVRMMIGRLNQGFGKGQDQCRVGSAQQDTKRYREPRPGQAWVLAGLETSHSSLRHQRPIKKLTEIWQPKRRIWIESGPRQHSNVRLAGLKRGTALHPLLLHRIRPHLNHHHLRKVRFPQRNHTH